MAFESEDGVDWRIGSRVCFDNDALSRERLSTERLLANIVESQRQACVPEGRRR